MSFEKIEREIARLEDEKKTCGPHIGFTGDTCMEQYLMDESAESMRLLLDLARAADEVEGRFPMVTNDLPIRRFCEALTAVRNYCAKSE